MNNIAVNKRLVTLTPEEIAHAYERVFNNDDGRLVLQDLINRFCPSVPDVAEDVVVDPYRAMINIGKRSVMFHIENQLIPEDK